MLEHLGWERDCPLETIDTIFAFTKWFKKAQWYVLIHHTTLGWDQQGDYGFTREIFALTAIFMYYPHQHSDKRNNHYLKAWSKAIMALLKHHQEWWETWWMSMDNTLIPIITSFHSVAVWTGLWSDSPTTTCPSQTISGLVNDRPWQLRCLLYPRPKAFLVMFSFKCVFETNYFVCVTQHIPQVWSTREKWRE